MWSIQDLIVHGSTFILLLFTAFSYACGLFYLAQLAEEYPTRTGKLLRALVVAVGLFFVLLYLSGAMPLLCGVVGVASQVSYHRFIQSFPLVHVPSRLFFCSLSLFLLLHVVIIHHLRFSSTAFATYNQYYDYSTYNSNSYSRNLYRTSNAEMFGMLFVMVWLTPLSLIICACTQDYLLPDRLPNNSSSAPSATSKRRNRNFLLVLLKRVARKLNLLRQRSFTSLIDSDDDDDADDVHASSSPSYSSSSSFIPALDEQAGSKQTPSPFLHDSNHLPPLSSFASSIPSAPSSSFQPLPKQTPAQLNTDSSPTASRSMTSSLSMSTSSTATIPAFGSSSAESTYPRRQRIISAN